MENIFISQPRCVYAKSISTRIDEECYFPLHHHRNESEILFITKGQADYRINNQLYRVTAGTIILFHQHIWHEERSLTNTPFEYFYAGFNGLSIKNFPSNYLFAPEDCPVYSIETHFVRLQRFFNDLVEEMNSDKPNHIWFANHMLSLLLGEVFRVRYLVQPSKNKIPAKKAVLSAGRFITENYHRQLTLKDISDFVYMSPSNLSHLFQESFNTSPIKYLIEQRILAAKEYLTSTDYNVEHICSLIGYNSVTTFQNTFRKITGMSPGKFRNINQKY